MPAFRAFLDDLAVTSAAPESQVYGLWVARKPVCRDLGDKDAAGVFKGVCVGFMGLGHDEPRAQVHHQAAGIVSRTLPDWGLLYTAKIVLADLE